MCIIKEKELECKFLKNLRQCTHFTKTFWKLPKVESKGCGQPCKRKMEVQCVKKIASCALSTNSEQITRNMVRQRNVDCQWKIIVRVGQTAFVEKHELLMWHMS
jgi:hypothetical protein